MQKQALKNGVNIREGFPTFYEVLHNIFEKKNMGAPGSISIGYYIRKIEKFGQFLKKGL